MDLLVEIIPTCSLSIASIRINKLTLSSMDQLALPKINTMLHCQILLLSMHEVFHFHQIYLHAPGVLLSI